MRPAAKAELAQRTQAAIENLESNLRVTEGIQTEAKRAAITLLGMGAAQVDIDPYHQVVAWCEIQIQSLRSLLSSAEKILESLK